ncbi:MobA/MobL family protein, partial [Escherichia coli]|uniref:MobA/MobL family protein n=1 Tax=Escherichia coli TaxID=562 RepID=UPI003EE15788
MPPAPTDRKRYTARPQHTAKNTRDNPSHFWQAADQFERANGSTYRELEIALPRELTPEQRLELV